MAPWFEQAGELSRRLVEHGAWSSEEGSRAEALAWRTLQWGRTTRQSEFSAAVLEAVFRRALGLPVVCDTPMSSGSAKVAALATGYLEGDPRRASHVIWDSRVSIALVFRLDELIAGREGLDTLTIFPRIGTVPRRRESKRVGGARHPSRLRLRWSHACGRWAAQDAGSKLVRELRDTLNGGDYGPMPTALGRSAP